jgi:diketogulonate reductase-like aldo/keto reductase
MVRNIKLNDGKSIPAVAWGNGTGGLSAAGKKAVDTGALALREGIRHIDTAQSYRTEEETGLAIKAAGADRKAVWVTTKRAWGSYRRLHSGGGCWSYANLT